MTPTMETKQTSANAPDEFSEIIELTKEEKRELLEIWKSGVKSPSGSV